jgi:hypothetical protein
MDIDKLVHNTEQRFKTVESETIGEFLLNYFKGNLKSVIRGGILGGALGYALGGDLESFNLGVLSGAVLDSAQNAMRLFNLYSWSRDPKGIKKYEEIKQEWKDLGYM